ncbi:uncharacterized protein LOC130664592 isoform X2 [Microplitis mediator]|nr:uncharacterized protein LOC130664592 isoform X2 [Microplitis mediator]
MGARTTQCALWLKKQGVSRGDVVGLCSKNHLDSCIPLLASFYLGAIFNPWWDSCLDEELVTYFINTTKPKVLFVDEDTAEIIIKAMTKIDYSLPVVIFGKKTGLLSFKDILQTQNDDEVSKFKCTEVEAEDPALIICTSGTTSCPKGALHSYRSCVHMIGHYPTDTTSQTILWFSSLCWISGVLTTIRSIIYKATMIVSYYLSEEEACRYIEKYKITRLTLGSSVANRLSKTEQVWKYDVSSITLVLCGGGILKSEVVEFLRTLFRNAAIYTVYGSTECGIVVVGKVESSKLTSCGKILANIEIKVVDPDTSKILGPNENGELLCRSQTLMTRYWNNPAATEEAIDSEGWYHTGDLGYYDNSGNIFIVERIKELIKCRRYHIPPAAIESVIQDLPGVAEVAVVAKPSFENLEVPMAFVTKVPGMQITEAEINEAIEKKLHDRMKLRGGICFLEKMPYTNSKKISKKELRAMARALAENKQ